MGPNEVTYPVLSAMAPTVFTPPKQQNMVLREFLGMIHNNI